MPTNHYTTTCTQNQQIARDIHEIRFKKPDGFTFIPGQFVLVDTPLVDNPEDRQVRAYSIASTPDESDLLFVVHYQADGRFSEYMKQQLEPGTEVQLQGPLGRFILDDSSAKDLLFICTGAGNAPFRSMIKHALQQGATQSIDLIYGVRSQPDLFWADEFQELADAYPNFHLHVSLTQPEDGWTGLTGRVQTIVPSLENIADRTIYICGNPDMTTELKELCLADWQCEKPNVHVEGYI